MEEALEKLPEKGKQDDVPPSPSSSEEEEKALSDDSTIDEEGKKDQKCKAMVDFYIAQLEDMEHKTDLYTFWFIGKTEPTLKNLNTEYESRRSQLVHWHEEGRDQRVSKVLDMLHNVYLLASEHVMKPRKSTRSRNKTEKVLAMEEQELSKKLSTGRGKKKVATKKGTTATEPKKRSVRKEKEKAAAAATEPKKQKQAVGKGKEKAVAPAPAQKRGGTPQSSVPPKKRIYRGRDKDPANNVNPLKPPENIQKAKVMKNGTLKRSVYSRPTSVPCLKDQTARNKFRTCAKNIGELQFCTTFGSEDERKFNPKVQHFMVSYDEVVQKPHLNKALPIRPEPVCIFLPPEGFELKSFAKMLKKTANEMEKKSNKGYRIAKTEEEYFDLVFGPKLPPSRSKAPLKAPPKASAADTEPAVDL